MLERFALILLVLALAPTAGAVQITDERGVAVSPGKTPQRIVSLLPSLTETVCELGACARLVGVDRYSNYPASVRSLPRLGGGIDPNIEAIVALQPDLVLLATSSRAAARLQSLGLNVVALEPRNFADVRRVLGQISDLLDLPSAEGVQRVWDSIQADLQASAKSLAPRLRNARVYFEVNNAPYAAGQSSFIGEILTELGLQNIVPGQLGPYPKINPEFVVRADPDFILLSDSSVQEMNKRPGWSALRAVRSQRVCVFNSEQSDVLVRAGPRMAQAARLITKCLTEKAGPP
jgi:iron complex transport system substrate-binding protein